MSPTSKNKCRHILYLFEKYGHRIYRRCYAFQLSYGVKKIRDTSGGIIICAEVVDPAVPDECANVDISSNAVDTDESTITTLAVPADGNDFIAMVAENLRKQLASQGINVKLFNATE